MGWVHVDSAGVCGVSGRHSNGGKRRDVHIVGNIVSHKHEFTVHQSCGSCNAPFHKNFWRAGVHEGDGFDRVAVVLHHLEVGPGGTTVGLPLASNQGPWDDVSVLGAKCRNASISLSNVRVLDNEECSLIGVCCHDG